jgi:hypothetical protein
MLTSRRTAVTVGQAPEDLLLLSGRAQAGLLLWSTACRSTLSTTSSSASGSSNARPAARDLTMDDEADLSDVEAAALCAVAHSSTVASVWSSSSRSIRLTLRSA